MSDPVERLNAALEGRYRIERELGQGGMATVYLADDLKHERKVALKVLKPELAALVGAERFLGEIKTTANLQHPHILPLFDSGEADGFVFYVMPLVEGESLRDRLDREKQLGVKDSVAITQKVAGALDYAHEHGVVHRDIKPGNILLSEQGEPLVADFGIALAVAQAGAGRITETGLSLGTPNYMSPEQATGDRDVDPRSDVFALACVLYEMLAGEPPFSAPTAQAVLVRILTTEAPSITSVRRTVAPNVGAALAQALEKLPADRFTSAAEFAAALGDESFTYQARPRTATATLPDAVPMASGTTHDRVPWEALRRDWRFLTLALVAAIGATFAIRSALTDPPPRVTTRVAFLPDGDFDRFEPNVAISPDGAWFAWVANSENGEERLYLRRSDETTVRSVPGSEDASFPVFSPDGASIAFVAGSALVRASVSGGPARTITSEGFDITHWSQNETIVGHDGTSLYRVPAGGGTRELILAPDSSEGRLMWPEMLPGDEAIIYTSFASVEDAHIRVLDLESGETRTLVEEGMHPHYLPSGHLIFGHADQALFAVSFDVRRREVVGDPIPVLGPVTVTSRGTTQFAVATNGTAIYQPSGGVVLGVDVVLVDSLGNEEVLPIERGPRSSPRFSPDGRSISYVDGPVFGNVFVYSLDLGNTTQLTFEGINQWPFWSIDSALVTFASQRAGTQERDGYRVAADMGGSAESLFSLPLHQHPQAWAPDGQLLLRQIDPVSGFDLRIASFAGDSVTMSDYLIANWDEFAATVSPSGEWVAYVSDEDGPDEVSVRSFPRPAGRVKVSVSGGREPIWDPDGRTLYYRTPAGELVAARVQAGSEFTVVGRDVLFRADGYYGHRNFAQYDISPSGDRFVMLKIAESQGPAQLNEVVIVTNWLEELKRLVPN